MSIRDELLEKVRLHGGFDEADLRQIHERGVDAGWPGFTDYVETWAFYHKHHDLIWALVREHAESRGKTPIEIIASFDCAAEIDDGNKFKKAMSSFALNEAVCHFVSQETAGRRG